MAQHPSVLRLAFRQFWLLFGSIWLLVGSVFAIVGGSFLWKEYRYSRDGIQTNAQVVEKFRRTSDKGGTSYLLQYRFVARNAERYEGSDSLAFRDWDRTTVGDGISIVYLPDDPESNRFENSDDWLLAGIFAGIGGLFAPIGGGLVLWSLIRVRRSHRLMHDGVRVDAKVVSVRPTNLRVNRVTQWCVVYSFRDFSGQTHEAESDYMSPEDAQRWSEGDTGAVRYDQSRPEFSVWLGRDDS